MNTTELLQFHEKLTAECREIMRQKNHDYAGASGATPFGNFQAPEQLGLCSTETGIVMRMLDKLKRLVTFCNAGQLKVENEGAADACKDIVNYAIILAAYVKEKQEEGVLTPFRVKPYPSLTPEQAAGLHEQSR